MSFHEKTVYQPDNKPTIGKSQSVCRQYMALNFRCSKQIDNSCHDLGYKS